MTKVEQRKARLRALHDPNSLLTRKYRYFDRVEYALPYVEGGLARINLASSYLSDQRMGTQTPDEVRNLHVQGIPPELFDRLFSFQSPIGSFFDIEGEQYLENGLVLCMSNSLSLGAAGRLKKNVIVEISNPLKLYEVINAALGIAAVAAHCRYTSGPERNHFLKGEEDAVLDEFRFFWPGTNELLAPVDVLLPPGLGVLVNSPE
jgi:hypothetical protein